LKFRLSLFFYFLDSYFLSFYCSFLVTTSLFRVSISLFNCFWASYKLFSSFSSFSFWSPCLSAEISVLIFYIWVFIWVFYPLNWSRWLCFCLFSFWIFWADYSFCFCLFSKCKSTSASSFSSSFSYSSKLKLSFTTFTELIFWSLELFNYSSSLWRLSENNYSASISLFNWSIFYNSDWIFLSKIDFYCLIDSNP